VETLPGRADGFKVWGGFKVLRQVLKTRPGLPVFVVGFVQVLVFFVTECLC
jgi:hypothetical protein